MKNFTKILLIACLMIVSFNNCQQNSQYIDRIEDKEAGEQVTNKLYDFIKSKQYEEATSLFSETFLKVTPEDKLIDLFIKINAKLGDLEGVKVDHWETRRVIGSNPSASYLFVYKVKYMKFESTETIKLTKEEDDQIKIGSLNINIDGFFDN
jgi:hypothetical protein